jgi:hypothetical protein
MRKFFKRLALAIGILGVPQMPSAQDIRPDSENFLPPSEIEIPETPLTECISKVFEQHTKGLVVTKEGRQFAQGPQYEWTAAPPNFVERTQKLLRVIFDPTANTVQILAANPLVPPATGFKGGKIHQEASLHTLDAGTLQPLVQDARYYGEEIRTTERTRAFTADLQRCMHLRK